MPQLKGQLLIAGGGLFDPNFRQTVVLVVEHGPDGALGLVLNRPSPVEVEEAAPALAELVPPRDPLYLGGPVEPQAAVVLAELAQPELAEIVVFESVCLLTEDITQRSSGGLLRTRATPDGGRVRSRASSKNRPGSCGRRRPRMSLLRPPKASGQAC